MRALSKQIEQIEGLLTLPWEMLGYKHILGTDPAPFPHPVRSHWGRAMEH